MSRNVRQKQPMPSSTSKKTPKKARTILTSDDDDYSGVDLISDTEEDEPDVEVAEEQAIIESEEDEDSYASPQPEQEDDDASDWGGFELDDDPGLFFDEQMARTNAPDMYSSATGWTAGQGSGDESPTETARRVRFDLSDSDTAVSDVEDNIFPDIFLDQNSLDPGFRRSIENDRDNDNDDPPSEDGSYWDFRGDEQETPANTDMDDGNQSESSYGSSGYETDEGETTEEDLPAAAKYLPARSVLRRQSTDSSSSEEDITVIRRNSYRQPIRTGPRLGSWVTDASKPFAVMDSRGKKLMMFKARIQRRYSFNSGPSRPIPSTFIEEDDQSGMEQMSPMISNSANLMMSAMYTPMDSLGGQALGPPEAFYPFVSIAANGNITQDDPSSSFDEEDVDDDDLWNIGDLIDFGDDSTDDEARHEQDDDSSGSDPTIGPLTSTPVRPNTANSEDQAHPLLNHFNSGLVGAFRRNQTRHQLLSRNSASHDSLAFSGPYRQGPIRGIKGGRLAAANTPITPMRKTKAVKADILMSPTPMDPSAKKRKFSGDMMHGHKRTRSLI